MNKQERYDELVSQDENLTDKEITEQVQLFYELNPDGWQGLLSPGSTLTPEQQFGMDTSKYE